jgi:broad specificity phosphatase PhoE
VELLFVRHAQPEWSRDGRSVDNPGLTDLGHAQGTLVGERFQGAEVDALIVSPLVRAQQTAAYIAEALQMEPVTYEWLAEIGAPVWNDEPTEVVEQIFADIRRRPVEMHWEGIPGGESFRDFHGRVTAGLQYYLDEFGGRRVTEAPALWHLDQPDRRVVVVAHAGTNATALSYLLGIEPVPWEWERFASFHASVSEIRPIDISDEHAFSLIRFADVTHLPADHQTH